MPKRAPRPCRQAGCPELVTDRQGLCKVHKAARYREQDRGRKRDPLYNSTPWRQLRAEHLSRQPFCERCGRIATVVHHITPLAEAPHRGLDPTNLEALCFSCHSAHHMSRLPTRPE
jgi:5-methylcytosine-specific restriction protein A